MVPDSVLKNFGIEKVSDSVSEKIWCQKKYRIRYRKYLVLKKVSDSVSEIFGIEKSLRFGIEKIIKKYLDLSVQLFQTWFCKI